MNEQQQPPIVIVGRASQQQRFPWVALGLGVGGLGLAAILLYQIWLRR